MTRWLQLSWLCIRMMILKLHNEEVFSQERYLLICEFFDKVLALDNLLESRRRFTEATYKQFKDRHKSLVELAWEKK